MPAPTTEQIKATIEASFIANNITKREYDSNGNVANTGQLTDEQKLLILAISQGIHDFWVQWQASQTVSGQATVTTAPGVAPVTGILP